MATFRELQDQAHTMARAKGWWDAYISGASGRVRLNPEQLTSKLALVITEVSEAIECVRDDDLVMRFEGPAASSAGNRYALTSDWRELREGFKPEGLPSELADVVIRCMDLAGALDIDLEEAIRMKMTYNATRKHRHGGRKL